MPRLKIGFTLLKFYVLIICSSDRNFDPRISNGSAYLEHSIIVESILTMIFL